MGKNGNFTFSRDSPPRMHSYTAGRPLHRGTQQQLSWVIPSPPRHECVFSWAQILSPSLSLRQWGTRGSFPWTSGVEGWAMVADCAQSLGDRRQIWRNEIPENFPWNSERNGNIMYSVNSRVSASFFPQHPREFSGHWREIVDDFFKVFTEFVTIFLLFYVLIFGHKECLAPWTRDQIFISCIGR